jgi:hypothetical protein
VVQTAVYLGLNTSRFRTSLWSFGLNAHGQLARSNGSGSLNRNPTPTLIPRVLFPTLSHGNYIAQSLGNNQFHYLYWDEESEKKISFSVTISDGVYNPEDLANTISARVAAEHKHPSAAFRVKYETDTQALIFQVTQPGFQADFRRNDTMRANLGFTRSSQFPAQGVVNEVSNEAGNNIFRYKMWCANSSACNGTYSTFSLVLEDGLYTIERITAQVRQLLKDNGHSSYAFQFGFVEEGADTIDNTAVSLSDRVLLIVTERAMQVDFTGSDSIGKFLGFDQKLYPSSASVIQNGEEYVFSEYILTAESPRGNLNINNIKPVETKTDMLGQDSEDFVAGGMHTLVRTVESGGLTRLWSFGSNLYGQLGRYIYISTTMQMKEEKYECLTLECFSSAFFIMLILY